MRLDISHFRFTLFSLKFSGEIVAPYIVLRVLFFCQMIWYGVLLLFSRFLTVR